MITKMRNGISDHHTRKETRLELIHCEDEGMPWYMITKMRNGVNGTSDHQEKKQEQS